MPTDISLFPLAIDSRPGYVAEDARTSLLQLPLGGGTVLSHIATRLAQITRHAPRVLRTFEADGSYDAALSAIVRMPGSSMHSTDLWKHLDRYEPSDWILFVDPQCVPIEGFDPSPLLAVAGERPRIAGHLVALATTAAGTSERVEFDGAQRVRCVQRYYDSVTWTVARGVSCTLVPVSTLQLARPLPCDSLVHLRKALAAHVIPARDVPIRGLAVDLSVERGLLALNERLQSRTLAQPPNGCKVHATARLIGDVVLQPGVEIAEHATVIGPAVIGGGARVGRDAVVAQCVVGSGVQLADGVVARHRVVCTSRPASASAAVEADMDEDNPTTIGDERLTKQWYPRIKRGVEVIAVLLALILISPLLLVIAILVKLDSEGPILYGDPREAQGGRMFRCYKFRTMRVGAHAIQRELAAANEVNGPQFKMASDPRVTRIGGFLRKTSLDELPQLFNVVLGQMSLVGPRPSPFRENQTCVPWREARLSVRPGITGLWQVCRHDRQAGDFHQWIYYDLEYVRHQSLVVDLKILAATVFTGGGRSHVPLSWVISTGSEPTL